MFVSDKVEVRDTDKGKSIFAADEFEKDEIILEFIKKFTTENTKNYTIQVEENLHQVSRNSTDTENFLSHSCNPNAYINFNDLTLRALRKIKKGEEITFNYLTTEWDLAGKFDCKCGSENCYKKIEGFRYLTLEEKKKLKPLLSPFLRKKLQEEESKN